MGRFLDMHPEGDVSLRIPTSIAASVSPSFTFGGQGEFDGAIEVGTLCVTAGIGRVPGLASVKSLAAAHDFGHSVARARLSRDLALNATWITDHIAIGGRLSDADAADLGRTGVGAVVDLRSEAVDERAVLEAQGIAFLYLPTDDHAAITPAMLDRGVAFAEAQRGGGRRILIHCEHGIGRSATLALSVLVAGGMAPLDALALAKDRRDCVSPSPAQYGCWRDWLVERRQRTGALWDVPDFDRFAAIAYRHLAAAKA